ncbi:uncharacterized protein LOC143426977 isoform X1 [Xylocopa sonorina]|uniref:uncharacterized protein LOC143426977 isoform X1 n=1 Tax=Xylocopa sonorina TaxID=1818115 RepID=UPI00403AD305
MSTKHSPRKVTLAMIKGKPITTSVPVIHYHASDDELEEIYPSTDEEKRLTPDFEKISSKLSGSPSKSAHESDIAEHKSEARTVSAENILLEGTPPSLDPWKVFSDLKGKITKTFEEKLSEIKSDKRKRRHSRAESSSISDSEDQGCVTPSIEKVDDKQVNESTTTIVHRRGNAARYVGFSEVKTGLKDKSLQDESVESGIEASEFSQDIIQDVALSSNNDSPTANPVNNDTCTTFPQQTYARSIVFPKKINFKSIFSHSIKQLIFQAIYKSVAALIVICCIYYVIPLAEYLLGFMMGIFATVTFYDIATKLKKILTTLPEERYVSSPPIPVLEIPAVEEHAVVERFQGWLNELPYSYEPNNYHVARTKSVFFRLEGSVLRIMETRMKVPKKAVWDEAKHKLKFVKRRVYNLSGAKVELLPYGLTKKRRWSKKYPICITLDKKSLICNVILKSAINDESTMSNYNKMSPTKKVIYKSDKKCIKEWEEETQDEDEIWLVNTEDEESFVKQDVCRRGEEKDVSQNNSDRENYSYDAVSGDVDNELVKYEDCFVENGETEECVKEDKRKDEKYCKEQRKEDGTVRRNITRAYTYINRRQNKRKGMMNDRKIGKRSFAEKFSRSKDGEEEMDEEDEEEEEEFDMDMDIEEDEEEEMEEDEAEEEEEEEEIMEVNLEREADEGEGEEGEEEEYDEEEDVQVVIDDDDDYYYSGIEGEGKKKEKKEEGKGKEEPRLLEQRKKRRKEKDTVAHLKSLKNAFKKYLKKDKRKNELKIFIFARADREKEDWYRRLVSAASRGIKKQDSLLFTNDASSNTSSAQTTQQKSAESKSSFAASNSNENVPELSYNAYMAKYLDNSSLMPESVSSTSTESTLWINCLIARILFDVRKCPETINLIQDKIQRKLSNIKLPYFMECLLVSEVAIGQGAPIIRNVTRPVTNERGLWLDLDITYKGSLTMTVETKLNLMKLTRTGSIPSNTSVLISTEKHDLITRSPIFDSDLEDTPETSTEDDCDTSKTQSSSTTKETASTQSSGKKFLNMVDRIAANKYFQHATELSYVRRAMEGVSNTEIRLMVTVSSIEGCLSINIPPAPSDRLWYGFKPVPKVSLTVKPAVGERTVNIVYVTKWIEAKLLREFEKLVVLPNMDDLIVPLCPNYPYTTIR